LPLVKGLWGECIAPDAPDREEKLRKWGYREDDEFDEAAIMDRWVEEKKALWVPGQRYKNLSLESGMGSSKTVADSLAYIQGEGYYNISELIPPATDSDRLYGFTNTRIQTRFGPMPVKSGVSRLKQKTYKLRTKFGYEVGGAATHPVLVFNKLGEFEWKTIPQVQQGDFLCVERKPVEFGKDPEFSFTPDSSSRKLSRIPNQMTPELARFIGYLIGDGNITSGNKLNLTTDDDEIKLDFIELSKKLFEVSPSVITSKPRAVNLSINRKDVRDFLKFLGLGRVTAEHKFVPQIIRISSKETVRHFLRGLFDTDGFASCGTTQGKYGSKRRLTVGFSSISEELVKQVQVLLLGFGIISSRARRNSKYQKKDGSLNSYWTLNMYGKNARKFFSDIGFGLTRKQAVLSLAPIYTVDTVDKIPHLHRRLKQMKLREGMCKRNSDRTELWNKIRRQCGGTLRRSNPNGFSGITYEKLPEIIQYFKEVPGCKRDIEFLEDLLKQNLFFDQVTTFWETEEPLYDFEVPGVQEYVSGGLVSHNSSLTGSMSAYEFYRLTKMENPGKELGLIAGDPIFVLSIATNEQQAKDTIFAYTKARMESSAYFGAMIQKGEIEVLTTEIVHKKKNIIFRAGHSRGAGLVGKNLWGLLMDEVNRFAIEPGASVESSGLALWNNVGKGTTRFKHHPDGGVKIGIGSAWQDGDMSDLLWRQVEEGKLDARDMLCFRLCTWDVNPNYTGRDDRDLATFYASDRIGALRDYEGIRPGAQSDFFNKEMITKYSTGSQVAGYTQIKRYDAQGIPLLTEEQAKEMRDDQYRTYVGLEVFNLEEMPFPHYSFAHADPGIKKDSFGFAVGHGEPDPDGKGLITVIDLLLEWEPELDPNNPKLKIPVNVPDVEDNILKVCLARHVRRLSFDHWNSAASIQKLYTQGIITEEVTFSAPLQLAMYESFRRRLDNGLVRLPDPDSSKAAKKLFAELSKIQLLHGKKIDHPKGSALGCSKDLADAVVTVDYRIAQEERMYGLGPNSGVKINVLGATKLSMIEQKLNQSGFNAGRIDNVNNPTFGPSKTQIPRKWT
jgi:intein/homing endonuclease